MKLLIIINSLSTGGAEKLLVDTIPRYQQQGVEVTLCLLKGLKTPFLDSLEQMNACTIIKLSNSSVYNPYNIIRLRRILNKFHLVHAHLFPTLYWLAFANMFRARKSILFFTEHNTSNRRKGIFFKLMDQFVYSKYTIIIAIAEPVKKFLMNKLQLKNEQVELIHNGINISTFKNAIPENKTKFNLSNKTQIVIQVSSFTTQKDQDTLLRAMTLLPDKVHLFLVGDGPRRNECEQLANTLKINNRVHFLGIQKNVANLLKMAQVIVLSSHYEGLSLSSIEALASGVPFVASEVPGLDTIVEGAGILFDQGNEKQLANKIEALLNDSVYAISVAQKGYKRAQLYTIDKMVEKHIKLYKQYG